MEFLVHTQIWTAAAKVVESSETGRAGPLDIEDLVQVLNRFADDRDWQQFHSPKNLSMALSVEAAELLEHFQWLTQAESSSPESVDREAVAAEIADIQIYLAMIAGKLGIDIEKAVYAKIESNAVKYLPKSGLAGS